MSEDCVERSEVAQSNTYNWEVVGSGPAGDSVVDSGDGEFGIPDDCTGRTCTNHIEVGTAVFDRVVADIIIEYRNAVLDARLEDEPDPAPPLHRVSMRVRDGNGAEMLSTTAALTYPVVTVADTDTYRKQVALAEKRERRRRERRDNAIAAGRCAPRSGPADPRLAGLILNLRVEADTVREEVPDADHCREQLALAQNTVQAATEAAARAQINGTRAEFEHAHAFIQRWTPRINRWAAFLELTTEAYADADAVDALADRISLQPPLEE
ncbi:hypothetical protein ACIBG0_05940 [Nocardia sp. NPDC050630]|uniref:hypothetical protein n=1 Tax=Nocardia sp. NPDC050630 TaxID=3364321 RepID=UPI0037BAA70F